MDTLRDASRQGLCITVRIDGSGGKRAAIEELRRFLLPPSYIQEGATAWFVTWLLWPAVQNMKALADLLPWPLSDMQGTLVSEHPDIYYTEQDMLAALSARPEIALSLHQNYGESEHLKRLTLAQALTKLSSRTWRHILTYRAHYPECMLSVQKEFDMQDFLHFIQTPACPKVEQTGAYRLHLATALRAYGVQDPKRFTGRALIDLPGVRKIIATENGKRIQLYIVPKEILTGGSGG